MNGVNLSLDLTRLRVRLVDTTSIIIFKDLECTLLDARPLMMPL